MSSAQAQVVWSSDAVVIWSSHAAAKPAAAPVPGRPGQTGAARQAWGQDHDRLPEKHAGAHLPQTARTRRLDALCAPRARFERATCARISVHRPTSSLTVSIRFTRTGRHVAGRPLAPDSARLSRGPAVRSKTGAKSGQEPRSTRRSGALTMTTMDLSTLTTPSSPGTALASWPDSRSKRETRVIWPGAGTRGGRLSR